jgi:hypothetical protein
MRFAIKLFMVLLLFCCGIAAVLQLRFPRPAQIDCNSFVRFASRCPAPGSRKSAS